MIRKTVLKTVPLLVKLAVLAILAWIVLRNVDIDRLRDAITIRHYGYLMLGFGCMLFMPAVLAIRLAYVAQTTLSGMVTCLIKSFFFNNLFPGQVGGDIYKIFYLNKRVGEKKRVLAAVFGDRLIGVTGLLALSICCVVMGFGYFTDPRIWYALWVYLGIVLVIYVTVFFLPLSWLQRRLHGTRLAGFVAKIELTRQYIRLIIVDRFWLGIVLTLAAYGLLIVMNLFIMHALGLKVDVLATLLYIPVISIAVITLPISFNGLGIRESLYIIFFQMAGYTAEQALAMALVYLLVTLAVSVLGGVLLLVGNENITMIRAEQNEES